MQPASETLFKEQYSQLSFTCCFGLSFAEPQPNPIMTHARTHPREALARTDGYCLGSLPPSLDGDRVGIIISLLSPSGAHPLLHGSSYTASLLLRRPTHRVHVPVPLWPSDSWMPLACQLFRPCVRALLERCESGPVQPKSVKRDARQGLYPHYVFTASSTSENGSTSRAEALTYMRYELSIDLIRDYLQPLISKCCFTKGPNHQS